MKFKKKNLCNGLHNGQLYKTAYGILNEIYDDYQTKRSPFTTVFGEIQRKQMAH